MAEPDRLVFRDRHRAESFGTSAEMYDSARPSYPDELIAWLGESGRGSAADVGCGTGQVARLLSAAGWQVIGVEIDERMATVARSHDLDVVVTSFEHWEPRERFDLITSGQAWHWIDPDCGYRHAGELLRSGGRLALFWNSYRYDLATQAAFDLVVPRHAPHLLVDSVPFGTSSPDHATLDADMLRSSAQWFAEPEFQVFTHERLQSVEDWLAEMQTHSPMAILNQDIRHALLADLGSAMTDVAADGVRVAYETRVTSALRR